MTIWLYTLGSTLAISLLGLVGVLPLYLSPGRRRPVVLPLVGFAAGSLLGNAFFDLLPELIREQGGLDTASSTLVLAGVLVSFFLEQALRSRQCDHPHSHARPPHLSHMAGCADDSAAEEGQGSLLAARPFATVDLVGDTAHNFIDGLVVGGAYLVSIGLGLTTTLAVIAHEIPHELGDFAVLLQAGLHRGRALFYNFVSALAAVAGGIAAMVLGQASEAFPVYLIPFTVGTFIYLAVGALIPELHAHGRRGETAWSVLGLLIGIAMMAALAAGLH